MVFSNILCIIFIILLPGAAGFLCVFVCINFLIDQKNNMSYIMITKLLNY